MVEAVSSHIATAPAVRQRAPETSGQPAQSAPEGAAPKSLERKEETRAFDDRALDKIAARLVTLDSRLAISQDEFIRRFIYKFVNVDSGDVVRQYPHEEVVEALHAMEEARERFLDKQA